MPYASGKQRWKQRLRPCEGSDSAPAAGPSCASSRRGVTRPSPKSIPLHPTASHRISHPLPGARRTSVSLPCSKAGVEGAAGQTPYLGKGEALAPWLPTIPSLLPRQPAAIPPSIPHPRAAVAVTSCPCHARVTPRPPRCLAGALLLRKRCHLLVISTSERSLHFSKEEKRMQEIASQLG